MPLETIGLDWESFWAQNYSLTKISTSEYVRDRRFKAHGMAISRESENFAPRWVTHDDVPAVLASIDWSNTRLVSHNGEFDFFVLAERYGYRPARYFCSMAAARFWLQGESQVGLDRLAKFYRMAGKREGLLATKGLRDLPPDTEKTLGEYACDDVMKCLIFWHKFKDVMPEDEQRLMDITFRMFCDPVLEVDLPLVPEGFKDALRKRIAKVDAADWVDSSILRSNDKFAKALEDLNVDPPTKISKKTGKLAWAFAKSDEAFIELLEHPEPRVRTLVEARIESKSTIALTRALRLFRMGRTGKLAIALNYARAKTHRWSGSNKMNLQNFVRGSKLRLAIRAPEGWVICVADSSNIESWGAAWFAGQEDKLELFRSGGDPYNAMATEIYGRPIGRKRKEIHPETGEEYEPDFIEGFVGKTAELGLTYGMGAPKFQATCKRGVGGVSVDLDPEFCKYVVETWRRKHYMIVNAWGVLDEWSRMMAAGASGHYEFGGLTLKPAERRIWFPNGTSMHYPDIQFDDEGGVQYRDLFMWKKLYGGKLLENIIQKYSRDVIASQILQISEGYRIATMTHDEIIWVAPEDIAADSLAFGMEIMKRGPAWAAGWPLDAKGGYARNYSK